MFSDEQYQTAESELKKLRREINLLWAAHERKQAELYLASGWSAEQIASHENKSHVWDIPRGTRADIKRAIAFAQFLASTKDRFPNLRRWEFDSLFKSWGDDWPKIAELIEAQKARAAQKIDKTQAATKAPEQ